MERQEALALYRTMAISRAIEQQCIDFSGHWYAGLGEEAAVVGSFWRARADDVCYPHYRGSLVVHWMRGRSLEDIFLAIHSKRGCSSGGRHLPPFDGFPDGLVMPYVSVMLGPNIAFGAGTALAFRSRGEDRVALVGFGDGTSGTGDFHETLNLAAVLRLPVVFLCQNNQFSISTAASYALASTSVATWAAGYGMPATQVDGNDAFAVVEAVDEAVARARSGEGSSFVELLTYRRTGHFAADPATYRDPDVARSWELRDPLVLGEQQVMTRFAIAAAQLAEIRETATREVREAAAAAARAKDWSAADLDLGGVYERAY